MTRSATGRRWELPDDAADRSARMIAQRHDLPHLLACVLAMRGIEAEEVPQYLDPDLRELTPDPFCMKDMEPAAERFVQAVRKGERIAVFGDYDVDGATSIALLISWLRCLGQDARYHVPHRRDEGYGLGPVAMEKLGRSSDLVLTADCGAPLRFRTPSTRQSRSWLGAGRKDRSHIRTETGECHWYSGYFGHWYGRRPWRCWRVGE